MFRQLKKTLVATVIASLTLGSLGPAFADSADNRKTFTYTRDRTIQKQCFMRLVVASESCHLLYA